MRVGRLALVGQLAWLLAFSTVEYQRGALTYDFSAYNQGRWLLAHGHWYPYSTVMGVPYWRNQGPAFMWVLGPLTRFGPGAVTLLWLQAIAIAGAGWVALSWVAEWLSTPRPRTPPEQLARQRDFAPWAIGLVGLLLVANPGTYIGAAFDFHIEAFAALFALLTAKEIFGKARRRLWIWAGLLLLMGSVAGLYLIGVGVSGLLGAGRHQRRLSAGVIAAGLAWIAVLTAIHAETRTLEVAIYGYLAGSGAETALKAGLPQIAWGAVAHPGRAWGHLWSNRADVWANLAPVGLIGLLSPAAVGVAVLVLLSSSLANNRVFVIPSFQNLPAYPFVVVGTATLLVAIAGRRRRGRPGQWFAVAARPMCVALAALSLGWAAIWLPRYPSQWLTVTPAGSKALAIARQIIPADAEVVASQGISGRFSDRASIYSLVSPESIHLGRGPVFFVLSDAQGIEIPVNETESILAQVADTLGATLLEHQAGIWVFRWQPPPGMPVLHLQGPQALVPAWTLPSASGSTITAGPASLWHVAGNGTAGYVVYGDYWNETPGRYVATAEVSATGPANVEVWNTNTNTLLARRQLPATSGRQTITIPFDQPTPGSRKVFKGWGPFTIAPIPPPPGQPIEIRVFQPSGSLVNVYTVGVNRVAAHAPAVRGGR